ncbi:MAG: class A beta-lactamase-related serine hydrolase [Spirochaetaceae bacterium]|nr:MAG: class A beta-lactamase-related serine hydrolase [Spirochaetaceae bacterium]
MNTRTFGSFRTECPEVLGFDGKRLAQIAAVVDRYLAEGRTAGVVTAVLRDGALAWFDARGCRELASKAPMNTDDLFRIFSMTKPITSAAVMMLVEETKLHLTDPVSEFFPEYKTIEVYIAGAEPPFQTEPARREITIRDLLTHTSGLAYGIGDEHPIEKKFETEVWEPVGRDPDLSLRELARLVSRLPLVHQPGTHWRYSIAIDLLGAIVEEVAGFSFERFLRERFFEPLGMHDTFFTVPEEKQSRLTGLYGVGENGLEPVPSLPTLPFTTPTAHPNGGGGLVSTAADYLSFAQMLLNDGRAPDSDSARGERILGPRTVSMMMTDHFPPDVQGWASPGVGFGYGGSVITDVTQLSGYGSVGRFSWGGAASTIFWIDPAERLAGLMLQQIMPYTDALMNDFQTTVYQAIDR